MYLLNLQLFGLEAGTNNTQVEGSTAAEDKAAEDQHGNVHRLVEIDLKKAYSILEEYKKGKQNIETRVKENEQWYRLRHWEQMQQGSGKKLVVNGKSAWLFNSIFSKHSDAMDNLPEPNVLPREKDDVVEAEKLKNILPLVMENCDFEKTYSDAWWDKLKNGTAIYGVFWDNEAENGLGDITIQDIDIFSIFWEPGITDIQDSKNLFIVTLEDSETIKNLYGIDNASSGTSLKVSEYNLEDNVDTTNKVLVVDWYFKDINEQGNSILNYVKFVGNDVIYSSLDDKEHPEYAENGFYDHGLYPVFFDTLFPMKGTPAGFGFIDLCKDDQMHIDKLDSIILQNAYESGIQRYWGKTGGGINKGQFADYENRIVDVEGDPSESIMPMTTTTLPAYIVNHRQAKIDEMKETSSNRDVSQGSSAGGVTAAAAISALQEAGNKNSRDMIKGTYRTYTNICKMVIELIRQFYTLPRQFRIIGSDGNMQFVDYNNANLQDQQQPSVPGMEQQQDPMYRRAYFDIKVKAAKANPYSRVSQNELASNLYNMGAFDPARADQVLAMLDMMDFEGKDRIIQRISQGQTQQKLIEALETFIQQTTNIPIAQILAMQGQGQPQHQAKAADFTKDKSYAEQIANRATPNVEGGQK